MISYLFVDVDNLHRLQEPSPSVCQTSCCRLSGNQRRDYQWTANSPRVYNPSWCMTIHAISAVMLVCRHEHVIVWAGNKMTPGFSSTCFFCTWCCGVVIWGSRGQQLATLAVGGGAEGAEGEADASGEAGGVTHTEHWWSKTLTWKINVLFACPPFLYILHFKHFLHNAKLRLSFILHAAQRKETDAKKKDMVDKDETVIWEQKNVNC